MKLSLLLALLGPLFAASAEASSDANRATSRSDRRSAPVVTTIQTRAGGPQDSQPQTAPSKPRTYVYGEDSEFNQIRLWPGVLTHSPIMVLVPGGGWKVPGPLKETSSPALDYYRSLGWTVAELRYRPTFEPNGDVNAFPVPMLDTSNAIAWLRDHAETLGIDPSRIFALGRSAGAYNLQWAAYEGPEEGRPNGMLLFSLAISSCLAHDQQKVNGLADVLQPLSDYNQQKLENIPLVTQLAASPLLWIEANPERVASTPTLLATNKTVDDGVAAWGSPWAPSLFYEGKQHASINTYWTQEAICGPAKRCQSMINFMGAGFDYTEMGRKFWAQLQAAGA
ncbi:MAG: alpha/beta hydrolase [Planctomycetota bacterium]|jgi:hypothetical protein